MYLQPLVWLKIGGVVEGGEEQHPPGHQQGLHTSYVGPVHSVYTSYVEHAH